LKQNPERHGVMWQGVTLLEGKPERHGVKWQGFTKWTNNSNRINWGTV